LRHGVKKVQFNRNMGERKALMRSLLLALFTHESIVTTQAKAKAVKPVADTIIAKARRDDLASRRLITARFPHPKTGEKLFSQIAPRFSDRAGGYSRIIALGPRKSGAAPMARIELLTGTGIALTTDGEAPTKKARATTKLATVSGKGEKVATRGKISAPERASKSIKEKAVSRRQVSLKKEGKK